MSKQESWSEEDLEAVFRLYRKLERYMTSPERIEGKYQTAVDIAKAAGIDPDEKILGGPAWRAVEFFLTERAQQAGLIEHGDIEVTMPDGSKRKATIWETPSWQQGARQ